MLVDKYVDDKKDPFAIVTYMPELDGIQIFSINKILNDFLFPLR